MTSAMPLDKREFCQQVVQQLNQVAPVTARAMFGGYGLYLEGIMFALIADNRLYFKVGDANRDAFVAAGMEPFTYEGKDRPIVMSYYRLPDEVWDDPEVLVQWVEQAHQVARLTRKSRSH